MAIHKHKLSFDPAESDDYDVVASFLKASDGTLITHTGGALDVNIDNASLVVTATDLDIRDLQFAQDSVDVSGSSVTVSATDLDIRDLAFATDSVTAHQGGTWTIDSITNDVNVTATDLDIRDLSHAQDSIKIGDGTDFLAVEADGSINVNASEAGYSSCNNEAVSILTTATDVVATELSNRKELTIQNVGGKDIYIGCDNTVTLANGILVPKGATASFRFGAGINVHAIADGATSEIRVLELA